MRTTDAAAAFALVLLAAVLFDDEASLDDVDLFGLFEESFAGFEVPAAKVTRFIFDVLDVDLSDDFKLGLLAATVARLLLLACLLGLGGATLFRRVIKEHLVEHKKSNHFLSLTK